jgi:hypothetical protein
MAWKAPSATGNDSGEIHVVTVFEHDTDTLSGADTGLAHSDDEFHLGNALSYSNDRISYEVQCESGWAKRSWKAAE